MTIEVVHLKEAWMALPDMVVAIVRDQETEFYAPYELASPESAGTRGNTYLGTNPVTSASEYYQLIAPDKKWRKFGDKAPTAFADRDELDDPANWAAIGGRTVTAVYRHAMPFDESLTFGAAQAQIKNVTMEHYCFLQLDGDLPEGGPYTISCTGGGFDAGTLTYNRNLTRALCIHNTQVGYKPTDSFKKAIFSAWIPYWGTEGQVDLIDYLGHDNFEVINQLEEVVLTGNFTQLIGPNDITSPLAINTGVTIISANAGTDIISFGGTMYTGDRVIAQSYPGTLPTGVTHDSIYFLNCPTGSTCSLHTTFADAIAGTNKVDITATGTGRLAKFLEYPSTTVAPKVIEDITVANPGVVTITGHGYSAGQLLFPQRINGMLVGGASHLEGRTLRVLSVLDANNFTCQRLTSAGVWATMDTSGCTAFGGTAFPAHNNEMRVGYYSNQAATYTYQADFSALTTQGRYRIRIPGLGVGDPFQIHVGVYHTMLKTLMKGIYNNCNGFALDPLIGDVSRPIAFKDSVNIYSNYFESLLPAFFSSETGTTGSTINAVLSGKNTTWGRAETTMGDAVRVTGFTGGWRDAGDWDWHIWRHWESCYFLLEFGWRQMPAGATRRDLKSGFPNLTDLFDPVLYAGTDALGDDIAMALQYFDGLRVFQKVDGRVYSGSAYGNVTGDDSSGGLGGSISEYSSITSRIGFLHAADPSSNFLYAAVAAKAAHVFYDAGFTSIGDVWKASSLLAYDWADDLLADYTANGATGSLVQAYFVTKLNMKTNASWSDGTFATHMGLLFADALNNKKVAAACLYSLTNESAYRVFLDTYFPLNQSTPGEYHCIWEYTQADDGSQTAEDHILYYDVTTGWNNDTQFYHNESFVPGSDTIRTTVPCFHGWTSQRLVMGGPYHFLWRALIKGNFADPQTSGFYKLLIAEIAYETGANQQNLCGITGMGLRNPVVLIKDRSAMGIKSRNWPGFLVFCFYQYNDAGVSFFNFAAADSTSNYTQLVSTGAHMNKIVEPDYRSFPACQNNWQNTDCVTASEFVTNSQGVGTYINVKMLHCFDGNSTVEYAQGKRRFNAITH